MKHLHYNFTTKVEFTEPVKSHSFLLRCTPQPQPFQKIINNQFKVLPHTDVCRGFDSFGNVVISGFIEQPHGFFEFTSEGVLEVSNYQITESLNPIFYYQSEYTKSSLSIIEFYRKIDFSGIKTIAGRVERIGKVLSQTISYQSGLTTIKTTAHQVLEIRKGVCQDFAHLAIALCRIGGIAARYVVGFMHGEGFTHAWIEFYDNGTWYPFDPTHNRWIKDGYIKLAHGRDYGDCPVERGVFSGVTQQSLSVSLKVEGIDQ